MIFGQGVNLGGFDHGGKFWASLDRGGSFWGFLTKGLLKGVFDHGGYVYSRKKCITTHHGV